MRRLIVFLCFVAAVVVAVYIASNRGENGVPVEVRAARLQAVFRSFVSASGEIVAARYADIGSNIMGKIISLPVLEGQTVKGGQILARIDPVQAAAELEGARKQVRALEAEVEVARKQIASARSQFTRAEAVAAEAELTFRRTEQLHRQGVMSGSELDRAKVSYDAARADVETARSEIERAERALAASELRAEQAKTRVRSAADIFSKTEIRSPISGVVSRLLVREGEMVVVGIQNAPGTTLMTVSDLSGMNAEVRVAEADILRIGVGQSAEITLDALPNRRFMGEVVEVGTSALAPGGTGAAAREFKVVVRILDPDPGLRPGLTCDAEILTDNLENAVTVPLQAVVIREIDGAEQTGVFLSQSGTARFQAVRAGIIGGLEIAVEGLSEGDPVIVGPFQVLREIQDGARVTSGVESN